MIYGVARGTYTINSLSDDLSGCFKVERCWSAQDKRYLLALGRPLPAEKRKVENFDEPQIIEPKEETISEANIFVKELGLLVEVLEKNAELTKGFVDQSTLLENEAWDRLKELL